MKVIKHCLLLILTLKRIFANIRFFQIENEVLLLFEVVSSLKLATNFHIIQFKEIQPDVLLLPLILDFFKTKHNRVSETLFPLHSISFSYIYYSTHADT